MVVELMEKLADFDAGRFVELGIIFSEVAEFGGDDGPAVFPEPSRDGVDVLESGDETGAGVIGGNVVVFVVVHDFEIVGAGLDRGGLEIGRRDGVVGFDESDVLEEKLVTAAAAEDAALEKDPHLGRGALVVVGINLDDNGDFVRGVTFEDDVLEDQFFVTDAGALFDGPLDHVAGDAGLFGFFDGGEESGVGPEIGTTELGGDADFLGQLTGDFAFAFVDDRALCVEPLTSHKVRKGWKGWVGRQSRNRNGAAGEIRTPRCRGCGRRV